MCRSPQKDSASQPDSLLGSSGVTAVPWDLSQGHQVALHDPELPDSIMTLSGVMAPLIRARGGSAMHGLKALASPCLLQNHRSR